MGDAAATGLVPGVFDVVVMRHVLAHNGGREQEKRGAGATTLSIGLKLGELLAGAGLEVVDHRGWYEISAVPPGSRTPSWAARDAMVEAGFAAREDVDRWAAAWSRMDNQPAPRTCSSRCSVLPGAVSDKQRSGISAARPWARPGAHL